MKYSNIKGENILKFTLIYKLYVMRRHPVRETSLCIRHGGNMTRKKNIT